MTEKTIVFPESGGNAMCAGLMSMLGQQKSIDSVVDMEAMEMDVNWEELV